LTVTRVRIAGTGIICALGTGNTQVIRAIEANRSGIGPLSRFKISHTPPLPGGQAPDVDDDPHLPVTFSLARIAADQALSEYRQTPPDAVVIGVTTGGMPLTEELLKQGESTPEAFRYHGIGMVAQDLAHRFGCKGPVLTVSTACSSGGGAIALAVAMIQSGKYRRILAGGADGLCRLTYYGFKSLQLIDPNGSRPMDIERRGMSVAEGAGMLLLEAADDLHAGIEILGAGLSCDAHHPAQPHPRGDGALAAMTAALTHAGLTASDIDYVNLHGTGTTDNDRSEAAAVMRLFQDAPPPLSSIKGATGHCLAAAGAIEAVVAALCIEAGLLPANTRCDKPDPELNVTPLLEPVRQSVGTVLSNSFGFGGNNAAVVIGRRNKPIKSSDHTPAAGNHYPLSAMGWSTVTGAGFTHDTLGRLSRGAACKGRVDTPTLCRGLAPGVIRRVKRLSHMALALLNDLQVTAKVPNPASIFFGTGWGSLSETSDFLTGLFDSEEKFSSPTDFIGSVHNAAAGQLALSAKATGANLTLSGGDDSFEQALFSAQMLSVGCEPVMVIGADETHNTLSPLFDPSVAQHTDRSDGAGALMLHRTSAPCGPTVQLAYFANDLQHHSDLHEMVTALGGPERIASKYDLIMAGLPAAQRPRARHQLDRFIQLSGYQGQILDYRRLTGEYATAGAVATVFAVARVAGSNGGQPMKRSVLVLGLGSVITAIEVGPP
jgi:3-oxoacyl-[acyl-carrier-protein] synthase-1/3-oxoacyl-[acyl-carrier-protein] synthase II